MSEPINGAFLTGRFCYHFGYALGCLDRCVLCVVFAGAVFGVGRPHLVTLWYPVHPGPPPPDVGVYLRPGESAPMRYFTDRMNCWFNARGFPDGAAWQPGYRFHYPDAFCRSRRVVAWGRDPASRGQ